MVVGPTLLYLLAMNVFLRTHLFRDVVSAQPDIILVDYDSAYSIWPGRIHSSGLSIRGRDGNVEWILRIDRCDFLVYFSDLVHRKFHANHVRGDGLSMRLRMREDVITPETMSALPPVPGYDYPPLKDVGPVRAPLTDAEYKLWSIELDDVVATHVREIWIHTTRYAGAMEIRGRWVFRPVRWLDIGPATIDLRSVDVSFGMVEPWVTKAVATLDVTVHPLELQNATGGDIVDHVSVRGSLEGAAWVSNVANRTLKDAGVWTAPLAVPFALKADLDHGVLRPGTHLRIDPVDARVGAADVVVEATVDVDAHVDEAGLGSAALHLAPIRVAAAEGARARVGSIAATFVSHDLDIARHAFGDARYVVDVDGAEIESLTPWRSRLSLPADVTVATGASTADGHLEGSLGRKTGTGSFSVGVRGLEIRTKDSRAMGDVTARVNFDGSLADERVQLARSVVSIRHGLAANRGWRVDVPDLDASTNELNVDHGRVAGHVAFRGRAVVRGSSSGEGSLLGTIHLDALPAQRRLDLSGSEISLRAWRATISGLGVAASRVDVRARQLTLGPSGWGGHVFVNAPAMQVPSLGSAGALLSLPRDLVLEGGRGRARATMDIDLARRTGEGQISLAADDLRLRMGSKRMAGELNVTLKARQRGSETDLSDSEISFRGEGPTGQADWWGRVRLGEASLAIAPALRFSAAVSAAFKDGSPLTARIADSTPIPGWLLDAVSTKDLDVTGDLLLTPAVFAVQSVQARAKGANIRFEFGHVGQTTNEWALMLDLGVTVAGVDVANGQTQLQLVGAGPWFQSKAAALESVERRSE